MTVAAGGLAGPWCHWDRGPDGVPRFVGVGELDHDSQELLSAALNAVEPGTHAVVDIDLAAVTFVDAAAIGVFLRYDRAARRAGGRVRLINAADEVRAVLDILWPVPSGDSPRQAPRRSASVADLLILSAEIAATARETVARSQALCAELGSAGHRSGSG